MVQVVFEEKDGSGKLKVKPLAQIPALEAGTNLWLLGDEDDVFLVESSNSLRRSWRVRWYRESPASKNYD